MVNRMRPVLTEHSRTVGGAHSTQIARLRPIRYSLGEAPPIVAAGEASAHS
jgi:hypothetical protein